MSHLRLLVAPGPFKECLSAEEVADCIEKGIRKATSEVSIRKVPMSDGGTGFVKRIIEHFGGQIVSCRVRDPIGNPIDSFYGLIIKDGVKVGVIESAAAAGLSLVPREMRNPLITSTYGVGELVKSALDKGCSELIIGCGDTATNDGGLGLAKALGVRFLDSHGQEIPDGGAGLINLKRIDISGLDSRISTTKITVACNLSSILCGDQGVSYVYAPQKGATPEAVKILADALENYANVIKEITGKDVRYIPGGGGGGGLATALYAFMNAELRFSLHVVTSFLDLESYIREADIVITGEGRIDGTTASGKITYAVALTAKKFNLPVLAITGSITNDAKILYYSGIDYIAPICSGPIDLEQSISNARELIEQTSFRIMRILEIGRNCTQREDLPKCRPESQ